MSIATITTDMNIGPFKIPANGQNMIMNNYAQRKKLKVEFVIPEPMMSNRLATIQWCHKDYKFTHVILCSIHQLPKEKKYLNNLIKNMYKVEFHFALEGLNGKGKKFLLNCYKEALVFQRTKIIDSSKVNWLDLYDLSKN